GELEWVIVNPALRFGNAYATQPVNGPRARGRTTQRGMRHQRFQYLVAYAHHRIQTGGWLLENDADTAATYPPHLAFGQLIQIHAVEHNLSADDTSCIGQ